MGEREFAEIVKSTKRVVLSAIRKHLPARFGHAIDDIAQETYVRAYRGLVKGSFRGDSKIETWLYVIARNETLRFSGRLEREERKERNARESFALKGGEEEPVMIMREMIDFLDRLSSPQRDVFRLLAAGKSEREIAHALSIPAGTVKSRISRGRRELVKMRKEAGYG